MQTRIVWVVFFFSIHLLCSLFICPFPPTNQLSLGERWEQTHASSETCDTDYHIFSNCCSCCTTGQRNTLRIKALNRINCSLPHTWVHRHQQLASVMIDSGYTQHFYTRLYVPWHCRVYLSLEISRKDRLLKYMQTLTPHSKRHLSLHTSTRECSHGTFITSLIWKQCVEDDQSRVRHGVAVFKAHTTKIRRKF